MVSVTPLWGVNDKMSFQRYGGSLLSCNALSLIMGEWPHLRLAGIMRWTKIDVTLVHYLLYGRGYNRDYQFSQKSISDKLLLILTWAYH